MNWREHDISLLLREWGLTHLSGVARAKMEAERGTSGDVSVPIFSGKRFAAASAILLMTHLFGVPVAHAGVAVSPLQQQVEVKPGRQTEFSINLTNVRRSQQQRAQRLRVEVVDFSVSLDGTLAFGEEYASERSAVKWATLDTHELTLEPEESREIKGKISAPLRADGDYWCAVMVSQVTSASEKGVNVDLRTACGIFVRVARRNYLERLTIETSEVSLPQIQIEDNATSPETDGEDEPTGGNDSDGLKVVADVRNEGYVSCKALGTANIYSDSWRKVASIPMHSRRRRVLPGHTRRFAGVMSASLPPGDYILRFTFKTDSGRSRIAIKETQFQVNAAMARQWKERRMGKGPSGLIVEPGKVEQDLTAGRFTTAFLSVSSGNTSTLRVHCRLVGDSVPAEWLRADPTDFTLAPGMRRSIVCHIRIPKTAEPGEYKGIILIECESAGLIEQSMTDVRRIPVSIKVSPLGASITRRETVS